VSKVQEAIELEVPVRTAYNQWTQFEEFPRFMEHVEELRQVDDRHLHWRVNVAGTTEEFDAEITEQVPDTRIAWTTTRGRGHAGAVDFHPLGDDRSQIVLSMDAEPHGAVEKVADVTGIARRQVRGDLERFKALIEERGAESGAWRGTIDRDAG
jgi:uncharacterized membrane protein